MKTTIQNYSVIAKGEYSHKQTNEFFHIERFLIVRRKKRRFLLLDVNNLANETLTAVKLQIEQLDSRGNFLGETTDEVKKTSFKKGKFVLKRAIELAHNCVDVRIKVVYAEYGNYVYRLGDEGMYVTYEKPNKWKKLDAATVQAKTGNEGIKTSFRRFRAPAFVGFFAALVLIASAVIGVLHVQEFRDTADSDEFFINNLKYRFVDGEEYDGAPVYVTGYVGAGGEKISIPNEIDGHPVIKVETDAFSYNGVIKEVKVAEGVKIDAEAFYNCTELQQVTLLGNNEIGANAFSDCYALRQVQIYDATVIGEEAFSNAMNMQTLRIDGNGKGYDSLDIRGLAFAGITSLKELRINAYVGYKTGISYFPMLTDVGKLYLKNYNYSVTENGDTAKELNVLFKDSNNFYNNVSIRELEIEYTDCIPENFTQNCNMSLQSVKIHHLESTVIGAGAFLGCSFLQTLELPKKITALGEYAFANSGIKSFDATELESWEESVFCGCSQLKTIEFGEESTLTEIPSWAFGNCSALTSIELPIQLSAIGDYAFSGCSGLTSVRFPSTTKTLGSSAFAQCEKMEKVYLSEMLYEIGNYAFVGCNKLHEVYNFSALELTKGSSAYGEVAYNALAIHDNADDALPVTEANGFVFKNNGNDWALVDYVGEEREIYLGTMYLNGRTLTSYRVVRYAFDGENDTIYKVTIGNAVADMLDKSFFNLPNLRKVDCDGVRFSLNGDVFDSCYNLDAVVIPTTMPQMNGYAFNSSYCGVIYYEGDETLWDENSYKYLFSFASLFYFKDCIHEYGQWNYGENGEINTTIVDYTQIVTKDPTCTKQGTCEYHCPDCGYYYEDILGSLGHLYNNSTCIRCGYVNYLHINYDSLNQAKKLLQFDSDGFDVFVANYYSIRASEKTGATSKITITAKEDVIVQFYAEILAKGSCKLTIVVNGKTYTRETGSENYLFELKAGDKIEITCQDNRKEEQGSNGNNYPVSITNMYVSSLYEPV